MSIERWRPFGTLIDLDLFRDIQNKMSGCSKFASENRADETKGGRSCSDVASDARKRRSGQLVGLLPWDCPYCYEMLHELSRRLGCRRCRSTVGHGSRKPSADHVNRAEKRVEESPR